MAIIGRMGMKTVISAIKQAISWISVVYSTAKK
jgi:hypothetical protein